MQSKRTVHQLGFCGVWLLNFLVISSITRADVFDLSGWDLSGRNVTNFFFSGSTLTGTNLQWAIVTGASFEGTTSRGFTKEQLYSTASHQQKNLRGIGLGSNDLTGWDLSDQNLTDTKFDGSILSGTNWAVASRRLTEAAISAATKVGVQIQGLI